MTVTLPGWAQSASRSFFANGTIAGAQPAQKLSAADASDWVHGLEQQFDGFQKSDNGPDDLDQARGSIRTQGDPTTQISYQGNARQGNCTQVSTDAAGGQQVYQSISSPTGTRIFEASKAPEGLIVIGAESLNAAQNGGYLLSKTSSAG